MYGPDPLDGVGDKVVCFEELSHEVQALDKSHKSPAKPSSERPRRVIKRYSNRKLYDTRDSRYVTLLQIAEMIRAGEDVQIIDNASKEDKTEVTLALIISEELKSQPRSVPLVTLRNLIHQRGEKLLSQLREGPIGRLIPGGSEAKPATAEEGAQPDGQTPAAAGGTGTAGDVTGAGGTGTAGDATGAGGTGTAGDVTGTGDATGAGETAAALGSPSAQETAPTPIAPAAPTGDGPAAPAEAAAAPASNAGAAVHADDPSSADVALERLIEQRVAAAVATSKLVRDLQAKVERLTEKVRQLEARGEPTVPSAGSAGSTSGSDVRPDQTPTE